MRRRKRVALSLRLCSEPLPGETGLLIPVRINNRVRAQGYTGINLDDSMLCDPN